MNTKAIILLPHQVEAIKKISEVGHTAYAHERQRRIGQIIESLIFKNEDATCKDKTVGEVASLYNLHLYKGGLVSDTSDSLYTGNLTGTEVVDKVTKINDDGYIFLKLEDGRTAVIIGDK